ncbi:DedA family protein [Fuscovulum blasticum]|uniref:DedA family protein n=1 Tax=Fuscovulum blasticum TaxID=1075 RepID=UPI000D3E28F0|nr:VTT domain-containing protein [Fuscovulum blasticum]AWD20593.1 hypothetical protein B6K69_02095 [Fuscovulum blasticum]
MSIESLIQAYGPAAVFLGCFFEGETAALLGGVFAHRGLDGGTAALMPDPVGSARWFGIGAWSGMAAVAGLGAFLADQMWFLLSRHAPDVGPLRRLRQAAAASPLRSRLESSRHLMAMLFRFIPGTRIAGPILLAQTALSWPAFAALNGASVCVWALLFTGLGYHFGLAAEALLGRLAAHHWLWLVAGLALAGLAAHRLVFRRPPKG